MTHETLGGIAESWRPFAAETAIPVERVDDSPKAKNSMLHFPLWGTVMERIRVWSWGCANSWHLRSSSALAPAGSLAGM